MNPLGDAKRVQIWIPGDLLAKIDARVKATGMPRAEFLRRAAEHYLETWRPGPQVSEFVTMPRGAKKGES